jgi:hypothetical protein
MDLSKDNWLLKTVSKIEKSPLLIEQNKVDCYTFYRKIGLTTGTCGKIENYINFTQDTHLTEKERLMFCYISAYYCIYKSTETNELTFVEALKAFFLAQFENNITNIQTIEHFLIKRISKNSDKRLKFWDKLLPQNFLFCDILAWHRFLNHQFNPLFLFEYQSHIIQKLSLLFDSKLLKTRSDERYLRNLIESADKLLTNIELKPESLSVFEKKYLIELIIISAWIDADFNEEEQKIVLSFQKEFELDAFELEDSLSFIENMMVEGQSRDLFLFSKSKFSIVQQKFIENAKIQITKNKSRIIQEISDSKELIALLAKSSQTKLSKEEQKKVRTQLLDILKVIPSIAIFMLPAGTLLLPLIIKILPKKLLFPSSFMNEDDEE